MARNFGKNSEIRIPPQSTGPRILNSIYQSVSLTAISGGTVAAGQDIVGQTSSASGVIEQVNGSDILVVFDPDSPSQTFTDGETVDIDGATITASANSPVDMYVNVTQIADADNPYYTQRVDEDGCAQIRFNEGDQQLTAFGTTKVSQQKLLDEYRFQYLDQALGLSDTIVGSATATHLPDESSVNLATTTGATDSIVRQSNRYHPYVPGVGRSAQYTLAVGDTGKANNARRWGLFDDENGVFFELDGTTFSVVQRSNTSGTPVDTKIAQADWNGDVLDGTGGIDNRSLINLDITQFNIFWIDYAWLGAGRVRFGIFAPDGKRIVVHTVENSNTISSVYMTTGSLPIRWENVNTGVTSGSSSLKIACAGVYDEASDGSETEHVRIYNYARTNVSAATGSETVLVNVRTATTFNSITNRVLSVGKDISLLSETDPVIVRLYKNVTLGGSPSWAAVDSGSPIEVDTAGTFSSGTQTQAWLVGSDQGLKDLLDHFDMHLNAAGTTSKIYTFTAQSLGGAASDTAISFRWIDRM